MVRASNQMNDFLESGRASRGGEGRESPAVQSYEQISANARNPPTLSLVQRIPCQMLTSALG